MLYSHTIKLVRFYPGVDGLKTGFTDTAKYCLTATAKKNSLRVISVVMGAESTNLRSADTTKMLDYAFSQYEVNVLLPKTEILGKIKLDKAKHDSVPVVPIDDITELAKKGLGAKDFTKNIIVEEYKLPLKKGDTVGYVELVKDGTVFKKSAITVQDDVEKAGIVDLFYKYLKDMLLGNISLK